MSVLLGSRLKELREKKGLSQKKLAEQLNINQQRIANYENNIREPNYEMLLKICNFFEVSPNYLLDLSSLKIANSNFLVSHTDDLMERIDNLKDNSNEQKLFLELIKLINILEEDYLYFNKPIYDGILQNHIDILKLLCKIKAINNDTPKNDKINKIYLKSEFFDIKIEFLSKIDELFDLYLKNN